MEMEIHPRSKMAIQGTAIAMNKNPAIQI